MAYYSRTVRGYAIHGRISNDPLDYGQFFHWFQGLPRSRARIEFNTGSVVALEHAEVSDELIFLRLVTGNPDEVPLVYDETTGSTIQEPINRERWRATPTRVAVSPEHRLLALESRRSGVGVGMLEAYFRTIAATNDYSDDLRLDFNPIPSVSFLSEVDKFERIRQALIEVRRPNMDWDEQSDRLSELADESRAHRASISVTAARGDSLDRGRGLMELIRSHVGRPLSNVSNVKISGRQFGSAIERTVSLENHQLQVHAQLHSGMSPIDQDSEIFDAEVRLVEEMQQLAPDPQERNSTDSD